MKKENIELDYNNVLDLKFIEKVGSPLSCQMFIPDSKQYAQPVKDLKILVIRLESCAELYALNNSVTYITDNKEKYDKFLNKVNDEKFGSDDNAILFNDWKNIDKLMENRKFDVCIMIPPYDRNLHLQILSKTINFCDKIVNISPVRWLQDPLAKYKKTAALNKFSDITKKIENVDLIDVAEMNSLFAIGLGQADGIYLIGKGGWKNPWTDNHIVDKIVEKILKSSDNLEKHIVDDSFNGMCASVNGFSGINGKTGEVIFPVNLISQKDFYTNGRNETTRETYLEYRTRVCWGNNKPKDHNTNVKFDTVQERLNFGETWKSKVLCAYRYMITTDIHVQFQFLPWLDCSKQWTDEDLCKYFGITGYIDDNTAEPGSEWEMILDCVKNN